MIEVKKGEASGKQPDLTPEIARFEKMSSRDVDACLEKYGLDPTQTVIAVNALVRTKLAQYEQSGPAGKKKR